MNKNSPLLDLLFSDARERIYARIDENVAMAKVAMKLMYDYPAITKKVLEEKERADDRWDIEQQLSFLDQNRRNFARQAQMASRDPFEYQQIAAMQGACNCNGLQNAGAGAAGFGLRGVFGGLGGWL